MPQITLPIADHDAPLAGDELSGIALNYQWRRILVHLAERMLDRRIYDGTEAEIDTAIQQVHALLSDMYTPGGIMAYQGAFVGRSTGFTLTTTQTLVTFDDDVTYPHHDTDGFFNPAFPNQLAVPAGMGGYYAVGALVQMLPGTLFPYIGIETNGTDYLTRNFSPETNYDQIRATGVWWLNSGASFRLRAWMNAGSRDSVAVPGFHNWSAQMWCHRLGDAP